MARKANTQAITAKMYRHFAIFTIGSTLALAVFADGEGRKAMAGEVDAPHSSKHAGSTELKQKSNRPRGSFTRDDSLSGDFGAPMDVAGSSAHEGVLPDGWDSAADAGAVPAGHSMYGVSADVWARMTEQQRQELIARFRAQQAAAKSADRKTQISDLMAASRARSGHATAAD